MSHIKYRSGDFTVATPCSGLRNESPLLPELNDVLVFHQDFVQRIVRTRVHADPAHKRMHPRDAIAAKAVAFKEVACGARHFWPTAA